jgi:hypothetical protein
MQRTGHFFAVAAIRHSTGFRDVAQYELLTQVSSQCELRDLLDRALPLWRRRPRSSRRLDPSRAGPGIHQRMIGFAVRLEKQRCLHYALFEAHRGQEEQDAE